MENIISPNELSDKASATARSTSIMAIWVCAVAQLLIEFSIENAACVFLAGVGSSLTIYCLVRRRLVRSYPLPVLVVGGFNVATLSGALVAQTLGLRPIVFNLQVPIITFGLCVLFQVSLLIAFYMFATSSTFRRSSRFINLHILRRLGIMQTPSPAQLWIMGLVGLISTALTGSLDYSGNIQYGDVSLKFLVGVGYLSFAPFLIPILKSAFPQNRYSISGGRLTFLLLTYLLLMIVAAMIRNSRGTFVLGVSNLGMVFILLIFMGQLHITRQIRRRILLWSAVIIIMAPILSDFAIAMVVVRAQRTEVTSYELVKLTIDAFNDKDALQKTRAAARLVVAGGEYEENYLANPFISRFVQTKFFDNSLAYEPVRNGEYSDYLWQVTLDKFISIFPTPIIRVFGSNMEKRDLEFSLGDALYYVRYGVGYGDGYGGYRTGSPLGHGFGIMGYFVFVAIIPLFLLIFLALQAMTMRVGSIIVISPVILLQLMFVYSVAVRDSLLDPVYLVLRALPEGIFIYWIIFQCTRWINAPKRYRHAIQRYI